MKLPALVHRNLLRRPLATTLTLLSVALGVGLFAAIGAIRDAVESGFQRSAAVCDLVVGPKGSSMELVLNALYHMGASPGNIPFGVYEELSENPAVLWSVPLTVGDSYRGQRIVGVTGEFFTDLELPGYGPLRFAEGSGFALDRDELVEFHRGLRRGGEAAAQDGRDTTEFAHEDPHDGHADDSHDHDHDAHGESHLFVAVVGSQAARNAGLELDSSFVPAHDLQGGATAKQHEDAATRVVGVLEPTGTPIDRAIYIPVTAFYSIAGHEAGEDSASGGTRDPLGLSAVMVRTNPRSGASRLQLRYELNNRLDVQAAQPVMEIRNLFRVVGDVDKVLRLVAALVVVVALVGVLVAIYNTMGARRREFAILRALGARRRTVLAMVMGESAAIAFGGGLLGMALALVGAWVARGPIQDQFGVAVSVAPGWGDLALLLGVAAVGALAGLVPALSAYRTEAARYLAPQA